MKHQKREWLKEHENFRESGANTEGEERGEETNTEGALIGDIVVC